MEADLNKSKELFKTHPDPNQENGENCEKDETSNLQETYEIDEESFYSDSEMSMSEETTKNEENYLYFLQSVKDGNCDFLTELIKKNDIVQYIERKDQEGILPLQYATMFGNIETIDKLIELGADTKILLEGVPLIHLSLTFSIIIHFKKVYSEYRIKCLKCFNHLSIKLDKYSSCDRLGRSILHYIIMNDLYECLEKQFEERLYYVKDFNGDTPIDYLYIYSSSNCFKIFLRQFGGKIFSDIKANNIELIDKSLIYNCYENLKELSLYFLEDELEFPKLIKEYENILVKYEDNSEISIFIKFLIGITKCDEEKIASKLNFNDYFDNFISEKLKKIKRLKTLIVFHQMCEKHGMFPEKTKNRVHKRMALVENTDRLSVLLQPPFGVFLSDYFIKNCVFKNNSPPASLADISKVHDYEYINRIRNICMTLKKNQSNNIEKYDSDTYISQSTFDASLQAAGCVIDAIDQVLSEEQYNAFVAIRPPGHHAGYFGKVESEFSNCPSSNGFCFFNNVIVGASYCKYKYKEKIKKIAIIDFDVHHGNGSEELIRNLAGEQYKTINNDKFGLLTFEKTICTPWYEFDDMENVLFISLHGYNKEDPRLFYPFSGGTSRNTNIEDKTYPGGILNIPIHGELKLSYGYRNIFRSKVITRLNKFKPDIIFISAGFDGHVNEAINDSYMQLNEFDYRWMTEEIMKVSKKHCEGRVVSVLEGGYNINSGVVSSFAQSVFTHVKFLNIGLRKNEESENSKLKKKREFLNDLGNYRRSKKQKLLENDSANEIDDKASNYVFRKRKHNKRFEKAKDKKKDESFPLNNGDINEGKDKNDSEILNIKNVLNSHYSFLYNDKTKNDNISNTIHLEENSNFNYHHFQSNEDSTINKDLNIEDFLRQPLLIYNEKFENQIESNPNTIDNNDHNDKPIDIMKTNDINEKTNDNGINNEEEFELVMNDEETSQINK